VTQISSNSGSSQVKASILSSIKQREYNDQKMKKILSKNSQLNQNQKSHAKIENLVLDPKMAEYQITKQKNQPSQTLLSSSQNIHLTLSASQNPFENPNMPNLQLEDFIIGEPLGEGKFGKVFLGQHKASGYIVAIKKISKMSVRMHRCEFRIVNELRIHFSFSHPNVIDFYGYF
jgi:hypothetical protein